jgi:hypothetical protein
MIVDAQGTGKFIKDGWELLEFVLPVADPRVTVRDGFIMHQ